MQCIPTAANIGQPIPVRTYPRPTWPDHGSPSPYRMPSPFFPTPSPTPNYPFGQPVWL